MAFKKLSLSMAAILLMSAVSTTALAASVMTVTDNKGNPISVDSITVIAKGEESVNASGMTITDDKGNPIVVDSFSITANGQESVTMQELGFTPSDLQGKDSYYVDLQGVGQKRQ